MLIVRGTTKLRDRVKGPVADASDESTTVLGDWFATALFWRPQVAMLVNTRTFLPVFMNLAPATTLLDRAPDAIASVLRRHGVDPAFIAAERDAMGDARIAPTNDRSVLGVMNEFAFLGEVHHDEGLTDLEELSLRLAGTPVGPLRGRTGFPDRELHAAIGERSAGDDPTLARVIPFPRQPAAHTPPTPIRPAASTTYQLKVTLQDTKPPVWRRVLVDGDSSLDHLHEVIQAAFGWWNYHLHEFEAGRVRYGIVDPDEDWNPPRDERRTRLDAIAKTTTSFKYTYDFGDGWDHKITVEKAIPTDPDQPLPALIDGRRACPPEDCGGTWGYRELLTILADPTHPEHQERLEWTGGPIDPEAFDPSEFDDNLRAGRLAQLDDLQ